MRRWCRGKARSCTAEAQESAEENRLEDFAGTRRRGNDEVGGRSFEKFKGNRSSGKTESRRDGLSRRLSSVLPKQVDPATNTFVFRSSKLPECVAE